ncbi:hypothetical protein VTO42DRAFT_8440 [Malbranchea cinnamomea]
MVEGEEIDDAPIACKACGEILEEGKAYELAGNRWHIDCFRCHTCGTYLDSDANLLMLGDGSLICNNCTYSCSACGNKIEDVAILTGDQAFCANCFKCRNCKRKIDNLRYARTSQGIFCMDCHESLMARRRKRTARNAAQQQRHRPPHPVHLDKSLPSLPSDESTSNLDSSSNVALGTPSDAYSDARSRFDEDRHYARQNMHEAQNNTQETLILPSSTYSSKRHSVSSRKSDDGEEYLIPVAFDPTTAGHRSPQANTRAVDERFHDHLDHNVASEPKQSHSSAETSNISFQEKRRPEADQVRRRQDGSLSSTASESIQSSSRNDSQQGRDSSNFKLQDAPKGKRGGSRTEHEETETERPVQSRARETGSSHSGRGTVSPAAGALQYPPKRGDSLESRHHHILAKKDVPASFNTSHGHNDSKSEIKSGTSSSGADHTRTGSRTVEQPPSKRSLDISTPMSSPHVRSGSGTVGTPSCAPEQVSTDHVNQERNESPHTPHAEVKDIGQSPTLLRYSADGEFSFDEDMARILRDFEENGNRESFLRRISNSVRHRSYSDKGHSSKGPQSPSQEIGRPGSSEIQEDVTWLKNELKRERQRLLEKDQKIAELKSALNAAANIKQVNTELHEKRSTMVVLDAQKEIVLRELEVLTEHIAAEKRNDAPLDLNKMSNAVLRDLAESIRRLKESLTSQIEELIQKRNELVEEIGSLGRMKDKSFQEFEQLSSKNAQLAELNNQLVHQIQGLYKATSNNTEGSQKNTNGMGIYSHQKDKSSTASVDIRDLRRSPNDAAQSGSGTGQAEEAEPAAVIQGPQVVNIRKAQPRKFNWKKGQTVAKGVTKGIKGAFSYQRDGQQQQFTETGPYGSTPAQDTSGTGGTRSQGNDTSRQGFGFFGNQKHKQSASKGQSNGNPPVVVEPPPVGLFGTDLETRLEIEKGVIPSIVTRCIEEVELRGMDVEGIYRKSGGSSQVQFVREGFERSPDFDISDPDLDIHAVTSALKQYFRRLPVPLITYPVYDKLLDACNVTPSPARIELMQRALQELPRVHRDVLEFLIFHLKRVVEREKENLMSSQNIAVVFAPTIMRPESLSREMTDVQKKNETVQFLVDNCQEIFMGMEE